MKNVRLLPTLLLAAATGACASMNGTNLVEAPRVRPADDRQAQISLSSPGTPGAATFRVFAEVRNPNSTRLKVTEVKGSLFLAGQEAAEVEAPLDLELKPRQETVVPIEVRVPLDKSPGLAQSLARSAVGYRVDGTMKVETEQGEPVFGPLTLLEGEAKVN
jgi:LEA14-like dessication related protein